MFGILGNVMEAAAKVVILPVSVVADVVTMGGHLTDKPSTYTGANLSGIVKSIEKIVKE